jgi:lipopolysaccharide/colanic/teichoic acid biosynthesis glycosyltransferase
MLIERRRTQSIEAHDYLSEPSMREAAWRVYTVATVGCDAIMVGLSFLLAAVLRDRLDVLPFRPQFDWAYYGSLALLIVPGLLGLFWLKDAYARDRSRLADEYPRVVSGCTYGVMFVIAVSYSNGATPLVSRGWLLLFWILSVSFVCAGRAAIGVTFKISRRWPVFAHRVLVVGANDQAVAMVEHWLTKRMSQINVIGFLDDYLPVGTQLLPTASQRNGQNPPTCVLGQARDALALVAQYAVDLVVVIPGALTWEGEEAVHRMAADVRAPEVLVAPSEHELTSANLTRSNLGGIPLFRVGPVQVSGQRALIRYLVDAALACLLLVIILPVAAYALAMGRLRGVHPLVQRTQVCGRLGRPVVLPLLNPKLTDQVLVRGALAIPAVFRNQLALAGPRPVPWDYQRTYEQRGHVLSTVTPGLTGPWRLVRPGASVEECVAEDVWWVRRWSVWQHLIVLWRTAFRYSWPRRGAVAAALARWEFGLADPV